MTITEAFIRELPKVELHVHLEGTIKPGRIEELSTRLSEKPPRPIDQLFAVDNLADFLATLDWVCGLVRDPLSAEVIAYDFAQYANSQNIVYAEVIANPTHWSGIDAYSLLRSFAKGFDRAERAGLGDFRLLPSLLRQQSAEQALELVRWILEERNPRIVGLSIDGNEAESGPTSDRFAEAFRLAGSVGLGRTAHAGESSGPEGVRDAIEVLGVSRVDHGIRCIEDQPTLALVEDLGITLNICLTSNCKLVYGDLEAHPIRELWKSRVPLTINTDDPETLGVSLCSELKLAADHLLMSQKDLIAVQGNAITAAFCSEREKARLFELLGNFVGP